VVDCTLYVHSVGIKCIFLAKYYRGWNLGGDNHYQAFSALTLLAGQQKGFQAGHT